MASHHSSISEGVSCSIVPFNYRRLVIIFLIICNSIVSSKQQSSISLNSAQWFVSNTNKSIVLPAHIPGGIYTDLRRNNVLKQDLLYGKNDIAYRWVGNENWTYTTSFSIDQQIARSQSVKLILHGVDTVSTVYLNGQEVGTTDNMFVRYKFDIKPHLKLVGLQNTLVITFESPIKYGSRKSNLSLRQNRGKIIPPYCPSPAQRGECHVNFIRKMQASFSWDWGPAFPSVGLYKDVEIEFGSFGIIRDILVETRRLAPIVPPVRNTAPNPPVIITTIRQPLRAPIVNKTVPYIRAPPYYIPLNRDSQQILLESLPQAVDITSSTELLDENWLLRLTLVAEMVQPSFGYNIRVEFNLNNALHYESEHINVIANSDGFIRLGFNLRIDTSRMRVKPWWPNNAGSQTLYKLIARMMPIPNPIPESRRAQSARSMPTDENVSLRIRNKPNQSPAMAPVMMFLSTQSDANTYHIQHISEKEISFGFRTVELIQEPVTKGNIEDGLTFNFRVNGVDLFAMGSNWIPSSVLPEYSNDEEYIRYLLQSAKDANMNMLRVWGGGIYESDKFYSIADEMGIMIWHDFMFACALYPTDDDFLTSVRLEIEQQVQRLQYHPSIVLWAGNNENEMAIAGLWWPEIIAWGKSLREMYSKLYVETIRPIVQILDPTRPYIESSPSNGIMSQSSPYTIARTPNDNKFGDVHYYDYLSDSFDWTSYPSTRFASEYGFQSYPSFNSIASISSANDWKYPLNNNILHRQHRITGDAEIKLQIKMHFKDLEHGGIDHLKTFLYISQLTQAIAIKTETEFYRRNRFIDSETKLGKTMGALYWQLNDVWQAPTWSSIEYGGKWKMLHYFARRFFFPIQVMPYLIQPPAPPNSNSFVQQILTGSPASFNAYKPLNSEGQSNPTLVVDLVRDDLFNLLDSFNVTIKFYRWTSFEPVWQDTVYVKHARPQNVTRIYEMDTARIMRQPGVFSSLSKGVFQVIIEQQPYLGLSQIENYLLPVNPPRITAMRVPKINIELVEGPFELTDIKAESQTGTAQWDCAYRLTILSDSIAMFVWLDLNLLNLASSTSGQGQEPSAASQIGLGSLDAPRRNRPMAPENIHLDRLPLINGTLEASSSTMPRLTLPEHIRVHIDRSDHAAHLDSARFPEVQNLRQARNFRLSESETNRNHKQQQQYSYSFKPLQETGSNLLRFQFSDNAFNMFEPSKVIDLYLSRCLSRTQVELALEVQTLAEAL